MYRTAWAAIFTIVTATMATADTAESRSFAFVYEVSLDSIPETADSVKLWIPVPQTTPYQEISRVRIDGVDAYRIRHDRDYGNAFAIIDVPADSTAFTCTLHCEVTRHTRRDLNGDGDALRATLERPENFLQPNSLVVTDGPIAEEARNVAGAVPDPLGKARALYDHIVGTVRYDKSGTGWGQGDTLYACDSRAGNCTDFHSLFIGEARALDIPSRFLMGFPVPSKPEGEIGGYHCWAEFYLEGRGWIPVDASEAYKDPSRKEELFGGLDQDRVQFTIGRDIRLPEMQGAPLNYSIYPYAEVDGEPFETVSRRFRYRDTGQGK